MNPRELAVTLFLASAARLLPAQDTMAAAPSPNIVNGTLSSAWPAVGALTDASGNLMCTATAISARWLVTAAHCVVDGTPSGFRFIVGSDPSSPSAVSYAIDRLVPHPNYDPVTTDYDIGLMRIEVQHLPVQPFKLNTQALSSAAVGRGVSLLGYGLTSQWDQTSALKRLGQTTITEVRSLSIQTGFSPSGTCFGDSGAPVYVLGADHLPVMLGVASSGDANCSEFSIAQRIDAFRVFITDIVPDTCLDSSRCDTIFRDGFEDSP